MLIGIQWLIVGTFYLLTAMWMVFLWLQYRGRRAPALATWMARLAVIEGAGPLNSLAGALIVLFTSGIAGPIFRPSIALAYAIAQVVYLHQTAKADSQSA